jgi:hypothetical protein
MDQAHTQGRSLRYVYLAGPITKGSPFDNVRKAIEVGDNLLRHGFLPHIPHLTALWAMVAGDKPWDVWLAFDEKWLLKCDCLLRIDGESLGADREVEFAKQCGIPVFYSMSDLYKARDEWVSSSTPTIGSVQFAGHSPLSISISAPDVENKGTQTT